MPFPPVHATAVAAASTDAATPAPAAGGAPGLPRVRSDLAEHLSGSHAADGAAAGERASAGQAGGRAPGAVPTSGGSAGEREKPVREAALKPPLSLTPAPPAAASSCPACRSGQTWRRRERAVGSHGACMALAGADPAPRAALLHHVRHDARVGGDAAADWAGRRRRLHELVPDHRVQRADAQARDWQRRLRQGACVRPCSWRVCALLAL